jgi:NAD(P)H dehydrogenase (quinone)
MEMSDTLLVYAHPNHKGHCGCFLQEIKKELERRKEPYEVLDLYAIGYDPVLKADEHYSSGSCSVAPQNKEFQAKIGNAKRLVFVFPVWWQSMPAILKGFIDRVLVAGFAFRYVGKVPKGLLQGRKAAVFTSSGAPRFFTKMLYGDRALKGMVGDTLGFCGIATRGFSVGGATTLTPANEAAIAKTVRRGLDFLW